MKAVQNVASQHRNVCSAGQSLTGYPVVYSMVLTPAASSSDTLPFYFSHMDLPFCFAICEGCIFKVGLTETRSVYHWSCSDCICNSPTWSCRRQAGVFPSCVLLPRTFETMKAAIGCLPREPTVRSIAEAVQTARQTAQPLEVHRAA